MPAPLESPEPGPYAGASFALLTRHEKQRVIEPLLCARFGGRVVVVDDFDTDTLGTFTRDRPRPGSQLEAARMKARIGMELSGCVRGLASEGSFSSFGFGSWNLELVLLVDAGRGIEIVGCASTPGLHVQVVVATRAALREAAHRAGFPAHGLVLRPDGPEGLPLRKGLRSPDELDAAFDRALAASSTGTVWVENDLRAHVHPTRMATIAAATADLVQRMGSRCAACGSPGFGLIAPLPGLPCRDCNAPTHEPRAHQLGCVACAFREERALAQRFAEPGRCEHCNP